MKAVIVGIKKRHAAALTQDGQVIKIKNNNFTVGQVAELKNDKAARPHKKMIWATSLGAAICLFGVSAWMFFSSYTYVSLDVNPSIEYSVNRFNFVISAQAVNGDGEQILENLHLRYKSIDDAITDTVNEIQAQGYFSGEEPGGVVIVTSSEDEEKAQKLADELQGVVEDELDENTSGIEVEADCVGQERLEEAQILGITPGKLNLIEKLQESSADPESIKVEEWMNKPVKDIMKTINENKKNQKSDSKSDSNSNDTNGEKEVKTQKTNNKNKSK